MTVFSFFRISWMLQLLVGIGLFSVSFLIEKEVMQAFLAAPLLALGLSITLEIGKAVAIVWHRYMLMVSTAEYPLLTRISSGVFRVGLVVLSLICSLLYLADHLDRPYLDDVRLSEIQQIDQQLQAETARLDQQSEQRLIHLQKRHEQESMSARQQYDGRVSDLELDRRAEMNNVIKGVFKGARYEEFERLIEVAKQDRSAALITMAGRQATERKLLQLELKQGQEQSRLNTIAIAEQNKAKLMAKDYATDERVNDPRIVAVLKIFEAVFDQKIQPLQFVFVFSVLLSVLMEVGILLAFDTVTVAMMPALRAQHKAKMELDAFKSRLDGEAQREEALHDSEMERVNKRAGRTMEEAQGIVDKYRKAA